MKRGTHRAPSWAFGASNAAIFAALARGLHIDSLREYFGAQALAELAPLAARARRTRRPGAARVLIVPGMMGSILCETAPPRGGADGGGGARTLWIDPRRIAAGHLARLRLPGRADIRPRGALLAGYARLKLELDVAGFDARFHAYDWRRGIDELGAALAARIRAGGKPVTVVAHSMGGLVARVAARRLPASSLKRLIMLGTPNRGAFAPVLALRGTYPFVQRLARLDLKHSAEHLAARVFCTFPGLYHLLPERTASGRIDLLDAGAWPDSGPQPDPRLLGGVAAARAHMADADSRMIHIVGVNRATVVAVRRTPAGFEYTSSLNGDGTVPAALAMLPRLSTYFAEQSHGELAGDPCIIAAVVELIRRGTCALPERHAPRPGTLARFDDAALASLEAAKIDWRRLDAAEREAVLADLDGGRPGAGPLAAESLA